jgi:E3 ubiquitin-protein ligase DOA10
MIRDSLIGVYLEPEINNESAAEAAKARRRLSRRFTMEMVLGNDRVNRKHRSPTTRAKQRHNRKGMMAREMEGADCAWKDHTMRALSRSIISRNSIGLKTPSLSEQSH